MNRYRVHYYYQNDKTQPVADDRDLGIFEADNPGDALEEACIAHCPTPHDHDKASDFMTHLTAILLTDAVRKDVPNVKLIIQQLRQAVEHLLSHVDYMNGACRAGDAVGGVLPQSSIIQVREILERTRI